MNDKEFEKNLNETEEVVNDAEQAVDDAENMVNDTEKALDETEETVNDTEETTDDAEETVNDTEETTDDTQKADDTSEKKKDNVVKAFFKSRKFRKGGFSIVFIAVFVAAVIVLNMVAGMLTDKIPALTFDLSKSKTSELSQDTLDFISTIDKEVTITVLADENKYTSANEYYLMANTLLKQYRNQNKKIQIKYIDLTANPTFTSKYPDDTLSGGNYIVECGDKHRVLTNDDLFEITQDMYGSSQVSSMEVEPAVTTAILNVTSENQTKVRFIDGFGDYDASAFKTLLEKNNYDVATINTLTEMIEESVEALVLYTPSVDLDDTSIKKIKDFLNNNGNYGKDFFFVASEQKTEMPKFNAFLEEWGMKMGDGLVAETDTSKLVPYYGRYDYRISLLDYSANSTEYTEGLKNKSINILGGFIIPIEITNQNTATPLLQTSELAKLVKFTETENPDIENLPSQQYNAAAIATKTSGNDEKSNVAVLGSNFMLSSAAISVPTYNNGAYIINLMNKLTDNTDEGITIDGQNLEITALGITTDQINMLNVVCMGVIPLVIVIVAVVIWVRRRNR